MLLSIISYHAISILFISTEGRGWISEFTPILGICLLPDVILQEEQERPWHWELHALLLWLVCGFFLTSYSFMNIEVCETGLVRRHESLTICRWNYKASTFFSVISRLSDGLTGVWTRALLQGSTILNRALSVRFQSKYQPSNCHQQMQHLQHIHLRHEVYPRTGAGEKDCVHKNNVRVLYVVIITVTLHVNIHNGNYFITLKLRHQ